MAREIDLGQIKEPFLVDREVMVNRGNESFGSSILSKHWGKDTLSNSL